MPSRQRSSTFIHRHFLRKMKNIISYGAVFGMADDRDHPYKNYEMSSCRRIGGNATGAAE